MGIHPIILHCETGGKHRVVILINNGLTRPRLYFTDGIDSIFFSFQPEAEIC